MTRCSRRLVRLHAWLIAAALLFTQAAFAVQACAVPAVAPVMAFSGGPDSAPCESMSGNLCLMQFLQGDQAVDCSAGAVIAPPSASSVLIALDASHGVISPAGPYFPSHTGPPVRTRLCRFLL